MGLEEHVEDVWTLFAAVATHKFVISFCMGIELVSAGTPLAFFLTYIITFAVMTPIGIGIGLAVTELAADSDHIGYVAATGTLQGEDKFISLLKLLGPLNSYVQCQIKVKYPRIPTTDTICSDNVPIKRIILIGQNVGPLLYF